MTRLAIMLAFASLCITTIATAAKVTVYLLDENGNLLQHGDAIVSVDLIQNNSLLYAGYYRNRGYYAKEFPDTPIIDVTVTFDLETRRKVLSGLSGRQDHVLFIRTDHNSNPVPVAAWAGGLVSTESDLLDDLDRMFPQGTPRQMTNVRTYLSRTLLKKLEELPASQDQVIQRERSQMRSRIMKHLK